MNYKKIVILEEDSIFLAKKIKVIKEDDSSYIIDNEDKCLEELFMFARQEGLSIEDLMSNKELIDYEIEETKETVVEETPVEEKAATTVVSTDKKEENDKSKTGIHIKRIVAGVVAVVVLGAANYAIKKNGSKGFKKFQIPYTIKVDYNNPVDNAYTDKLDTIVTERDSVKERLEGVRDNKEMSFEEYLNNLDNQSNLAGANMYEVSQFINGANIKGDLYYTNFADIYAANTKERAAVLSFCELRNNIVYNAYENKDRDKTKASYDEAVRYILDFVYNNKTLTCEAGNYKFKDLSPMAKNTILNISMFILTIERDFSYEVDGTTVDRNTAVQWISNSYSETMIQLEGGRSFK